MLEHGEARHHCMTPGTIPPVDLPARHRSDFHGTFSVFPLVTESAAWRDQDQAVMSVSVDFFEKREAEVLETPNCAHTSAADRQMNRRQIYVGAR